MKKQIKKLSLNKKTISNLTAEEMNKHVGGTIKLFGCGNKTFGNRNTCLGHNTCYNC